MLAGGKHGQTNGQDKESNCQVDGELLQHVGGLRPEHLAGHVASERRAQTFLTGALHEHDKNQKKADDHLDRRENTDEDVHMRGGEYGGLCHLGKRVLARCGGVAF